MISNCRCSHLPAELQAVESCFMYADIFQFIINNMLKVTLLFGLLLFAIADSAADTDNQCPDYQRWSNGQCVCAYGYYSLNGICTACIEGVDNNGNACAQPTYGTYDSTGNEESGDDQRSSNNCNYPFNYFNGLTCVPLSTYTYELPECADDYVWNNIINACQPAYSGEVLVRAHSHRQEDRDQDNAYSGNWNGDADSNGHVDSDGSSNAGNNNWNNNKIVGYTNKDNGNNPIYSRSTPQVHGSGFARNVQPVEINKAWVIRTPPQAPNPVSPNSDQQAHYVATPSPSNLRNHHH